VTVAVEEHAPFAPVEVARLNAAHHQMSSLQRSTLEPTGNRDQSESRLDTTSHDERQHERDITREVACADDMAPQYTGERCPYEDAHACPCARRGVQGRGAVSERVGMRIERGAMLTSLGLHFKKNMVHRGNKPASTAPIVTYNW
jgi:hypothetical protein